MKAFMTLIATMVLLFTFATAEVAGDKAAVVTKSADGVITITPVIAGESKDVKPTEPVEPGPGIDPVPNPTDPKPEPSPEKPGKLPCDPKVDGDCPVTNPVLPGNPVGIDPVPNPDEPTIVPGDPGSGTPVIPGEPGFPGDPQDPGYKPSPVGPGNPGLDPVPNPVEPDCSKCPVINMAGFTD